MKKTTYKKSDILEKICVASRIENLGFFIGSGFSKALMNESGSESPSWFELLKNLCFEYSIEEEIFNEGYTYPLIASKIIEKLSEKYNISSEDATKKIKNSIAKNVNKTPSEECIKKYSIYFKELNPQWIITTNYDSVIEKVVGISAYPILPNYLFYNTKNILPIYHIHGSVLDPQSIVITNEDYAKTMRPSDYRHSRLPILLKENTVLMIGYAIGDLNVLSAIDYRNNVYGNISSIDNSIIQLVYTTTPKDECYEDNGIIIYEFSDLSSFFTELIEFIKKYRSKVGTITKQISKKQEEFVNSSNDYILKFVNNDSDYRTSTISFINELDSSYCYLYVQYIPFLERVFNMILAKSQILYNFEFYDYYIIVLLDLIENIKIENIPTVYVAFLVKKLDWISYYLGENPGQGHAAYRTWNKRKNSIPENFITYVFTSLDELTNRFYLKKLLKEIENEKANKEGEYKE